MTEARLRCTVTRYSVNYEDYDTVAPGAGGDPVGRLVETTVEEITSANVRENGYLYLGNSEASVPWTSILGRARRGGDWLAQAGLAPVYVADPTSSQFGRWVGRNYPKIHVSADALLELERVFICDELWSMKGDETKEIRGRKVTRSNNNGAPGGRWIIDTGDPYKDIFRNLVVTVRELIEPASAPVPAVSAEDEAHARDVEAQRRIDDLARAIRGFLDDPPARDRLPLHFLQSALEVLERESAFIVGTWN